LTGVFFDFGIPQKTNMEEFMNKNFKFNESIERFAFIAYSCDFGHSVLLKADTQSC
jgi:hypothetical protein